MGFVIWSHKICIFVVGCYPYRTAPFSGQPDIEAVKLIDCALSGSGHIVKFRFVAGKDRTASSNTM